MSSSSIDSKQVRIFGSILAVFFAGWGGLAIWRETTPAAVIFCGLSLLGGCFVLFPRAMTPAFRVWLRVTRGISRLVNGLIFTLSFYLVITPAALLKRLFGGKPLPMKRDPHASTYWVTRSEPAQAKERFIKRY